MNESKETDAEAQDGRLLPGAPGSDFTVALQTEYDHIMVAIGMACRKSGGDLTSPAVMNLMAKADALDVVCKLWGMNPNT